MKGRRYEETLDFLVQVEIVRTETYGRRSNKKSFL
jgi:hypothetical protein